MESSLYQSIKLDIVNFVDLSKDAIHMHIGLAIFCGAIIFWQKGCIKTIFLIPVFVVACSMEALDLYDDFNSVGYMRWTASIHDIVDTTIWPVLIVLITKLTHLNKSI